MKLKNKKLPLFKNPIFLNDVHIDNILRYYATLEKHKIPSNCAKSLLIVN